MLLSARGLTVAVGTIMQACGGRGPLMELEMVPPMSVKEMAESIRLEPH